MLLVVILVVKVQSRWMEQGEGRREGKEGEGSRERGGEQGEGRREGKEGEGSRERGGSREREEE